MALQDPISWWRHTAGNAGFFVAFGLVIGGLAGIPVAGEVLMIPARMLLATLVAPGLLLLVMVMHSRRQEMLDRQENLSEEG